MAVRRKVMLIFGTRPEATTQSASPAAYCQRIPVGQACARILAALKA